MTSLAVILLAILSFVWWVIIIQAILSWLVAFDVINVRQQFVYQIWTMLNRVTEPLYRPIRNILPNMGGIDLSPIVVLFIIMALRVVIQNNLMGY